MTKYLRISSNIRKPFLIYDFATAPFWICMRKIFFSFYQCAHSNLVTSLTCHIKLCLYCIVAGVTFFTSVFTTPAIRIFSCDLSLVCASVLQQCVCGVVALGCSERGVVNTVRRLRGEVCSTVVFGDFLFRKIRLILKSYSNVLKYYNTSWRKLY